MVLEKGFEERSFISLSDVVTVTKTGHIAEIQYMEKMNHSAAIKKISKDEYVDLSTGEIKEFNHIENRSQSYNSLRQTFKKLRYLINNNFSGRKNELFVTLTYKEHVTDSKRLYSDMDKFMKKLKYKYKESTTIDYLSVVEPTGSGRWHVHQLLRFNDLNSIYIPNEFDNEGNPVDAPLYNMWGNGYVTIKSMKGVDNIGAYLSAYLSDIELTDDTVGVLFAEDLRFKEVDCEGEKKKFIKGGRLHMYPPGMNIFRKSKGILFPERKKMTYKKAKKIVGSAKPHYTKKYEIESDDFKNTIIFEQYNLKRL